MLQFMTDGPYHPETGTFISPAGRPCCYHASDNVQSAAIAA